MDNKAAIEYFYRKMELGLISNDTEQEAYEMAINALEKQIPKKPINKQKGYNYKLGDCPVCSHKDVMVGQNFCCKCGVALDWSEDKMYLGDIEGVEIIE